MSDVKEIVGARIGNILTADPAVIAKAVESSSITEWLDRRRMQMMAQMDLGEKWQRLASGPTLFRISGDQILAGDFPVEETS